MTIAALKEKRAARTDALLAIQRKAETEKRDALKGDVQARFEAYRIGREIGVFSPNDIRRRENETPIVGGDVYHHPANWTPLGSISEASA